jgi:cytochrome c oxidase cbb3-type subunit II
MKSGPLFFLGLFGAVGFSWAGIVIGSNGQLGGLNAYYDQGDNQAYPAGFPGEAASGLSVYRSLGCAACHTQQVRRPDFGSDVARGWGERQSVARDYIFQNPVELGQCRIGPDLANFGARKPAPPSADELMGLLYTGRGAMPAYRFLFQSRRIVGQQSDKALLPMSAALRSAPGHEIVPSERAQLLVSYLLSLKTAFDYPEARPPPPPGPAPTEAKKAGQK